MNLQQLQKEFENELTDNILHFWVKEVYDPKRKTFFGRITNEGEKFPEAPLSAVFTTRILWTFSAASRLYPTAVYKIIADEALRILKESFWDKENGGIYWSVMPDGTPVDTKKQFYAEAFFIYALSEYSMVFEDEPTKQMAITLFRLMEKHAFDNEFGGYFEAKTADWQNTDELRMIPGGAERKKSMNTHLHILEAYTNLHRVWKSEESEKKLHHLIRVFLDKITDPETFHFHLFFEADWTVRSEIDSYGHDIEGSWLLCEAAEVLGNKELLEEVEHVAIKIAEATKEEGFDKSGGLYYEKDEGQIRDYFSWWPQAETVVGFFNAWQLTGEETYLALSVNTWNFIQDYIVDKKGGEWFSGVSAELKPLPNDKVNGWKAPYHNGRMCIEMIRRIENALR